MNKHQEAREGTRAFSTSHLTRNILVAMLLGLILGLIAHYYQDINWINRWLVAGIFPYGSKIFLWVIRLFVVPIIFFSILCALYDLNKHHTTTRVGFKVIFLYVLSTLIAVSLAMTVASLTGVGQGLSASFVMPDVQPLKHPDWQTVLKNFFSLDVMSLAQGRNFIPLIILAAILGIVFAHSGKPGERIAQYCLTAQAFILRWVMIVIQFAPLGVFCMMGESFARTGVELILPLTHYIVISIFVLCLHVGVLSLIFLKWLGKLPIKPFFMKMREAMLLAFSSDSSSVALPVTLETVNRRLGVSQSISSLTIPLGATINMDGGAILQGIATVFIAHYFGVDLALSEYLLIAVVTVLATIGTAGLPSVGMFTLLLVLSQVGLPLEGAALILGVDRLLGMLRTTVNVIGDAVIACYIGASQGELDRHTYLQAP